MSFRALRARITLATAVGLTAALLTPTQGSASTPAQSASDTIDVTGTIRVLPGEDGGRDRYSLVLPSGRTIALAEGFTADPMSRFVGSLAVPGVGSGAALTGARRTTTLRRAISASTPLEVVDARVASPAPSPGPTTHSTYVAKVTNFGTVGLTDAQILAAVGESQAYWVRESSGQIPAWNTVTGVAAVASAASSFPAGCGIGNNGADFDAVAQSVGSQAFPGVDFSGRSPNHLVVVVPGTCGGTTTGRGNLGTSFADGGPVIMQSQTPGQTRSTLDHEFGHNVGLQHANNAAAEYGDLYQVMGADSGTWATPVLGTVYRWEQGIIAAGEVVDASAGVGSTALQPRSATSGLRGLVFINPDNGRRYFVDYRSGTGSDTGTCYASGSCNYTTGYGQTYVPGITVERENERSGANLDSAGDGSLQSGESWSQPGGRVTVTATSASSASVSIAPVAATVAGGAAYMSAPTALRDVTASGSGFSPAPAGYRYQWTFNGQVIPGAEEATLRPTAGMAGGQLAVVVTAYAPGNNPVSRTSAAQKIAPAAWYANGTRRFPEIAGKARVGEKLTALGLDWVNYYAERPADYAPVYRWTRNGKVIKGATSSTYRLSVKDKGKKIQVSEFPRAGGFGTTDFARSDSTRKVRIGKLKSPRPTIGGKVKVGKRVKARTSGWTRGTKFRYQWFVGKKAIRGASGKKLRITRSMKGKKIVVKVTGRKKGFRSTSAKSRPAKVKK